MEEATKREAESASLIYNIHYADHRAKGTRYGKNKNSSQAITRARIMGLMGLMQGGSQKQALST